MKILFIVDEFPFFLPEYLDKTVEILKKKHKIIGITPLVTPHGQKTLYSYLMQNIFRLGLTAVIKLSIEYMKLKIGLLLYKLHLTSSPYSISQVAVKHGIKRMDTENVNSEKYLSKLKKLQPDIIVSSCSQIFKKNILGLPKISCINRHSALLPAYGGLFPIFQAMIHNEKTAGATVHKMVAGIDKGEILAQESFNIKKNDSLFFLYKKSYEVSIPATVGAVEMLTHKSHRRIKTTAKPSYFSFPTTKEWNVFFKKKKKII